MTEGNTDRMFGRVKFFDVRKGFGFIKPDDGTRDVFISVNNLPKGLAPLTPDQRVQYVLAEGKKGPFASELVVL